MAEFNSQGWFTVIETVADNLYKFSDKGHVSYHKSVIGEIMKKYPGRLEAVKGEIYGDGGCDADLAGAGNRIDHHKIAALYIQLFLENPIFSVKVDRESSSFPSWDAMLINEVFCLDIMRMILRDWNDMAFDLDGFCEEYRIFFLKLLYYYKKHSELNSINSFFTHALAHLIYFIERDFFHK